MSLYHQLFENWERTLVWAQLRMARGNQIRMARNLGVSKNTGRRMLVRHGITDLDIEEIKKVLPPITVFRGRPNMRKSGIPRHRRQRKIPGTQRLEYLTKQLLAEFPLTGKTEGPE